MGAWPGPGAAQAGPPVLVPPKGRLSSSEARAARLAVPYLGPDPARSRVAGKVAMGVMVAAIIARLAAAVLYLQRSALDQQMLDRYNQRFSGQVTDPQAVYATSAALTDNRHTMNLVSMVYVLLVLAFLVIWLIWRDQRRPKAMLAAYGETHVESPLRWVRTGAHRWLMGAMVGVSILVGLAAQTGVTMQLSELPAKRMWAAVACLAWAAVWGLEILFIRASEQAHAERLAASAAERAGLVPVPVFAPLPNADQSASLGESEGALWVLRSAGLFMAALISGLVLVGALMQHTLASLPFVVVCGPIFGLTIWAYVRRFQRKAARRAAADEPPVLLTGYQ